jgi:SAM-dependent methyltransferase
LNRPPHVTPRASSLPEKILFRNPALYKIKVFFIETVILKWLLCGLFRLKPRPLTETEELFRGRRVLLAACGPGDVSTGPIIDGAAEVYACDFSQSFANACRGNRPRWHVCVANVVKLPFVDGQFDVAAIYSSLHHISSSAESVLLELSRVTHGRIILLEGVVPEKGILRRLLLSWYSIVDGGVRYYTREEVLSIAARLGLEVERATQHGPIAHMMFGVLRTPPFAPQISMRS